LDHLSNELLWLDVVIDIEMLRMRAVPAPDSALETFRGMFMTAPEARALLDAELPLLRPDEEQEALLQNIEQAITYRLTASAEQGSVMPFMRLKKLFRLSDLELRLLVVAAAPHLNRKYLKLYAYLQDDMTCQHVTIDLMLRLCCRNEDERRLALDRLTGATSGLRMFWFRQPNGSASSGSSILSTPIRLDDRMLYCIMGWEWRYEGALSHIRLYPSESGLPPLLIDNELQDQIAGIAEHAVTGRAAHVWMLHGPSGSGKTFHARHAAARLGLSLLEWDAAHAPEDEHAFVDAVDRLLLEAKLAGAVPAFDRVHLLQADPSLTVNADRRLAWLTKRLSEWDGIVFLFGEEACRPSQPPPSLGWSLAALGVPDLEASRRLWQSFTAGLATVTEADAVQLAGKFRFTPGRMIAAIEEFRKTDDRPGSAAERLHQAAYRLVGHRLKDQAVKMEPRFGWEDLILPPDTIQLLRQACSRLQHQHTVMMRWGFDRKLAYGKGTSMLFTGPPGTGKTMSAMVMARAMNAELYRIDLSRVVSKYIGETEKNLSRIFEQATVSGAILFFDEADALFGKRSEVKDAHDKYANMETSYLLQKMEEYDGLTILASNFAQNLDEAFTRRIQYIVKYPFPDPVQREQLWRSAFPAQLPVDSIDYTYLAHTFDLAGGPIKNIVLTASFMAAEEGVPVSMKQLIEAGIQEYKKIGKLLLKERLGIYAEYWKG
jgi:SpoVK/Ycf46/Vps4 family AAA+-type ATPase